MKTQAEIKRKVVEQSAFSRFFSIMGLTYLAAIAEGRVDTLMWVLGAKKATRQKRIEKEAKA